MQKRNGSTEFLASVKERKDNANNNGGAFSSSSTIGSKNTSSSTGSSNNNKTSPLLSAPTVGSKGTNSGSVARNKSTISREPVSFSTIGPPQPNRSGSAGASGTEQPPQKDQQRQQQEGTVWNFVNETEELRSDGTSSVEPDLCLLGFVDAEQNYILFCEKKDTIPPVYYYPKIKNDGKGASMCCKCHFDLARSKGYCTCGCLQTVKEGSDTVTIYEPCVDHRMCLYCLTGVDPTKYIIAGYYDKEKKKRKRSRQRKSKNKKKKESKEKKKSKKHNHRHRNHKHGKRKPAVEYESATMLGFESSYSEEEGDGERFYSQYLPVKVVKIKDSSNKNNHASHLSSSTSGVGVGGGRGGEETFPGETESSEISNSSLSTESVSDIEGGSERSYPETTTASESSFSSFSSVTGEEEEEIPKFTGKRHGAHRDFERDRSYDDYHSTNYSDSSYSDEDHGYIPTGFSSSFTTTATGKKTFGSDAGVDASVVVKDEVYRASDKYKKDRRKHRRALRKRLEKDRKRASRRRQARAMSPSYFKKSYEFHPDRQKRDDSISSKERENVYLVKGHGNRGKNHHHKHSSSNKPGRSESGNHKRSSRSSSKSRSHSHKRRGDRAYIPAHKSSVWKNPKLWWYSGVNLNRYRPHRRGALNTSYVIGMPMVQYSYLNTYWPGAEGSRCMCFDPSTGIQCPYMAHLICPVCGYSHFCSEEHARFYAASTGTLPFACPSALVGRGAVFSASILGRMGNDRTTNYNFVGGCQGCRLCDPDIHKEEKNEKMDAQIGPPHRRGGGRRYFRGRRGGPHWGIRPYVGLGLGVPYDPLYDPYYEDPYYWRRRRVYHPSIGIGIGGKNSHHHRHDDNDGDDDAGRQVSRSYSPSYDQNGHKISGRGRFYGDLYYDDDPYYYYGGYRRRPYYRGGASIGLGGIGIGIGCKESQTNLSGRGENSTIHFEQQQQQQQQQDGVGCYGGAVRKKMKSKESSKRHKKKKSSSSSSSSSSSESNGGTSDSDAADYKNSSSYKKRRNNRRRQVDLNKLVA